MAAMMARLSTGTAIVRRKADQGPACCPAGRGFEDYTSIEGKQEVTRYTVTHYEIGAEAEA